MINRPSSTLLLAFALVWVSGTRTPSAESTPPPPSRAPATAIRSVSLVSNCLQLQLDPSLSGPGQEVIYTTNLSQGKWQSAGSLLPGTTAWSTAMPVSSVFFSIAPSLSPSDATAASSTTPAASSVPPRERAKTAPGPSLPAKTAPVVAKMIAYEAWRGSKNTAVSDSKKYSPGLLFTPNFDGSPNPLEARLVFKALPRGRGLSRYIRFSPPGLVEFRTASESRAPWVPAAKDVKIPGLVGRDYAMDVSMNVARNWGNTTFVRLDYIVRDSNQTIVARDKIRLLAPVLMPLGDSVTFGFMRTSGDLHMTPPRRGSTGWSDRTDWCCYPGDSQWLSLPSPYNNPANKSLPKYQGYRGYLGALLPGFLWKGENVEGHGPAHMGYNGAHIDDINARAPLSLLRARCYAIVLLFEGLNDAVNGRKASAMYDDWNQGIQSLVAARRRCGKTLVVGVTLPRVASHYRYYNPTNQTQLVRFNRSLRSYSLVDPVARYRCADIEGVPHDHADGYQDDGLHFFAPGHQNIANTLAAAIHDGLR